MNLRLFFSLLCCHLVLGAIAGAAEAASFHVISCDAAADGFSNNAWTYSESGPGRFEHGDGCAAAAGAEYSGLWVREDLAQNSNIPAGNNAYWSFIAPASTTIATLTYSRHLRTYLDDGWRSELRADDAVLEDCVVPPMGDECDRGDTGGTARTFSGLAASELQIGARCAPMAPANTCTDGSSLQSVIASAYALDVTIEDPVAPQASDLGGTLTDGVWLRGAQSASFSAQDATGIDRLELIRDGAVALADDRPCDFTRPAPCASPAAPTSAGWVSVDTSTWPDGSHAVQARAVDAAGNGTSTTPVTVKTDNSAPSAPAVSADGAWGRADDANWSWDVPAEADRAPVDRVEAEICHDGVCAVSDASTTTGPAAFARPVSEGATELRVRFRDAAGNQGDWSAPVAVRRDRGAPPAPMLGTAKRTAGRYSVPVTVADPGPAPLTELEGEACPTNGAACRELSMESASSVRTPKLAPGRWRITVHARDAAGNTGPDAEAAVRVPRRRPHLKFAHTRVTRRRVVVRGRLAKNATGRVRVTLVTGQRLIRSAMARDGAFRVTFRQPAPPVGRLIVRARYSGDATYLPARRRRTVRLPASTRRGAGSDPSAPPSLVQP